MKSKEEIEKMAEENSKLAKSYDGIGGRYLGFIDGYLACQSDAVPDEIDWELTHDEFLKSRMKIQYIITEYKLFLKTTYPTADSLPRKEKLTQHPLKLTEPKMTDKDSWWCGKSKIAQFTGVSWQDAMNFYESNKGY